MAEHDIQQFSISIPMGFSTLFAELKDFPSKQLFNNRLTVALNIWNLDTLALDGNKASCDDPVT